MSATLATPFFNHHDYPNNLSNFRNSNAGLVNQGGTPRLQNPHYTSYTSNHNSTPDLRKAGAATPRSLQQQSTSAHTSTQPTSDMENSSKRSRKPNWHEFYKNGLPKEVIVIDDESPPPQSRQSMSTIQPIYQPAPGASSANGSGRHTDKKRKTTASTAYDPVYNKHYSNTQTPHHDGSASTSLSTDRTNSAYNTATTSLTSQGSSSAWAAPAEQEVVGQKRKRQTTRKTTADNKKREVELLKDPFSCYIRGAPPNPPIKAQDVRVPLLTYVRLVFSIDTAHMLTFLQRPIHPDKCDDEDGHYIVNPDTELTDRCMSLCKAI